MRSAGHWKILYSVPGRSRAQTGRQKRARKAIAARILSIMPCVRLRSQRLLRLYYLNDKVIDRAVHFLEPVWNPGRNYDYVSLGEVAAFSSRDTRSQNLIRACALGLVHSAARNESGAAIDHIKNV